MSALPIAANDNVRQFYVYQHRRNDTGEVFYIGKGQGRRAWGTDSRNAHWHNIVRKYGYSVEILIDGIDESLALALECEFIAKIGRRDAGNGTLVNLTDGGEGQSGLRHTEEAIAKISSGGRGLKRSEETRRRLSQATTGSLNPMFGHADTPETSARRRAGKSSQGPRSGKYKGVSLHKKTGLYRARVHMDGREKSIGYFKTEVEAAKAFDVAAMQIYGSGTFLNYPEINS